MGGTPIFDRNLYDHCHLITTRHHIGILCLRISLESEGSSIINVDDKMRLVYVFNEVLVQLVTLVDIKFALR